jgi:hypothetical protein
MTSMDTSSTVGKIRGGKIKVDVSVPVADFRPGHRQRGNGARAGAGAGRINHLGLAPRAES